MSFLKRIDEYFYEKSQKEFVYTLGMLIVLIVFVVYYFIFPLAQNYKNRQESLNKNYSSEIVNLKTNINIKSSRISFLNKKIQKEKNEVAILNKKTIFFTELVNLLDFAEFDQYKWANMVKNSVDVAKEKGLLVTEIKNKLYDVNLSKKNRYKNIIKRLDFTLKLKGEYKGFVRYIYDYENRPELIRVKEMKIKPDSYIVTFSVYGYNK